MKHIGLFEGIETGYAALRDAGIPIENYWSSEIDKNAIKVTTVKYPQVVHLGDVKKINIKRILLSEVYGYICGKYFTDESIQGLQSIISEREVLHRIDEKQSFCADFKPQASGIKQKVEKHTPLSNDGGVWFFRNPMGDTEQLYHSFRGGERRETIDFGDGGRLRECTFGWNGDGQSKSRIKETGFERINWTPRIGRDESEDSYSSKEAVFNPGIKGDVEAKCFKPIQRPGKKGQVFRGAKEGGSSREEEKETGNKRIDKTKNVRKASLHLQYWHDLDAPIQIEWNRSSVYSQTQVTVVEHEFGFVVFNGVIDLLLSGFPCTDLSVAGKQGGFDNDRSGLFFEAVRILRECQAVNPNVLFLFENVPMAKRFERVINETIGIAPWKNNSALVCAQNRNRSWWSNIRTKRVGLFGDLVTDFPQPKDRGIMLADILEKEVDSKYLVSETALARFDRSQYSKPQIDPEKTGTMLCKNNSGQLSGDSGTTLISVVVGKDGAMKRSQEKAGCFTAGGNSGGNHSDMDLIVTHNLMPRNGKGQGGKGHLSKTDGKSYCCDTGQTNAVEFVSAQIRPRYFDENGKKHYGKTDEAPNRTGHLEYNSDSGKTGTFLAANNKVNVVASQTTLRRLTPVEVCRLFTLPDNLFQGENGPIIAETNQYKCLGNGWVMKAVSHIFSFLPELH